MKNYLRFGLVALLIIGCYDNNIFSPENPDVTWGETSASTKFITQQVVTKTGDVSLKFKVTPGALYSVQLLHIDGRVLKAKGFKADQMEETFQFDLTEFRNGSYDLILMDVAGATDKIPLTINKQ
jgi:hypothetical protein